MLANKLIIAQKRYDRPHRERYAASMKKVMAPQAFNIDIKKITVIAVLNNALASDLTTIAKLVQVVDPEGMPVEA